MNWYEKYLSIYEKPFSEVPQEVINQTHDQLAALQSDNPLISIIIVASVFDLGWISTIPALSSGFLESSDFRQKLLARAALYCAAVSLSWVSVPMCCDKGKYSMCIDSDTLYPPQYIEIMVENLMKPGIAAVAAMWSFYPNEEHSSFQLKMYEFIRDIYIRIQNINRPELSVRGLAFGYETANAMKEGYRVEILRGEDGSMALSLKKYGKIKFIFDRRCRVITGYGSLKESSIFKAIWNRLKHKLLSNFNYAINHTSMLYIFWAKLHVYLIFFTINQYFFIFIQLNPP